MHIMYITHNAYNVYSACLTKVARQLPFGPTIARCQKLQWLPELDLLRAVPKEKCRGIHTQNLP